MSLLSLGVFVAVDLPLGKQLQKVLLPLPFQLLT